jgi:hypothetical protein
LPEKGLELKEGKNNGIREIKQKIRSSEFYTAFCFLLFAHSPFIDNRKKIEEGIFEEKNDFFKDEVIFFWQAPPPPIVGSGSGSSLQSPRLSPRRISASIPLAAEL